MKKLLLIALITFGAPVTAEATNSQNCISTVDDLIGFHLAAAPSIAYEYYARSLETRMKGEASVQEFFAEMVMVGFWMKLGEWHLAVKEGRSDDVDYNEIRDFICTGPTLNMFATE